MVNGLNGDKILETKLRVIPVPFANSRLSHSLSIVEFDDNRIKVVNFLVKDSVLDFSIFQYFHRSKQLSNNDLNSV